MKFYSKNYFLFILSAAAVLFITELLLRFIDPASLSYYRNVKLLHVYNPDYYVALAPDTDMYIRHYSGLWEGRFTTNSEGYRASPEANPGQKHIACLGDSLVMGFGVSDEDTFCSLLNGIEIGGEKFQTFNLGVDAFGSVGYLKRLEDVSSRMKLDMVLLFPSANDFNMIPELRAVGELSDDEKDAIREKDPSYKTKFRIQFEATRYSYLLLALKLSYEHLQIKRVQYLKSFAEDLQLRGFSVSGGSEGDLLTNIVRTFYRFPSEKKCGSNVEKKQEFCPWEIPQTEKCYAKNAPELALPPLPEITQKAYDAMIRLAEKRGFKLIPVMFPVHASAMYCLMHDLESPDYIFAHQMKKYFESRGIPVMNLSPYVKKICDADYKFQDRGKRPPQLGDILILGDGHLTQSGNDWIAGALKKELKGK